MLAERAGLVVQHWYALDEPVAAEHREALVGHLGIHLESCRYLLARREPYSADPTQDLDVSRRERSLASRLAACCIPLFHFSPSSPPELSFGYLKSPPTFHI